jgi:ATP-dependent helicase/nuclease subunit A
MGLSDASHGQDATAAIAEAAMRWPVGAAEEPGDAAARARALDPKGSFIVQAPAGSGKTSLLVQRYLRLLATVDAPEEIVAITFTRKAAGEMRERILAALDGAHDATSTPAHVERTRALARRVLVRDRMQGWDLSGHPGRLRVHTIDALCAALVRQMPWLSRFGGEPQMVEDARPLYRRAARETLEHIDGGGPWGDAAAEVLAHLDNDIGRCEDMLVALLGRRDQWLRHLGGGLGGGRAQLEAALAETVCEELLTLRASVPGELAGPIVELAAGAAATLTETGCDSAIRACRGLATLPGTEPRDLPAWLGLCELLLTRSGRWRARHTVRQGLPAADAEAVARARRLRAMLPRHEELRVRLARVHGLPPVHYAPAQWAVLEALATLLRLAAATLRVVFTEHGAVDYLEVAQAAREALGEDDAPTELALALDHRIRHVLVDEFQDTSHSQVELLRRLTAGWSPDDGRTLFVVGDPMQSIYRFREADVGLYLRAWEEGVGGLPLERLTLEANFRSQAQLVQWLNATFPAVFPVRSEAGSGAVRWRASVPLRGAGPAPAVSVHPFRAPEPQAEARAVLELVRTAQRRDPEASIAVLVRSRAHLACIVPCLRAAGIAYRGIDIERLAARPVVQDLFALTRALVQPADRVAWLAVLRAPWCGLRLGELHQLLAEERERTVLEVLRDERRVIALGDAAGRIRHIRALMERALAARGRRSLREAVAGLWCALGGPACVGEGDLDDATAYLDLLDELSPGGLLTHEILGQRLLDLFAPPRAPAARVEVMTIHRAKGLEFDIVILPGLGYPARSDERQLLVWAERPARGGSHLLLAPMAGIGAGPDPIYRYLTALECEKADHEAGRLLYVAATRAREQLHLLGHAASGSEGRVRPHPGSLLARLWVAVGGEFERRLATPPVAEDTSPASGGHAPGLLRRLPEAWQPPAPAPTPGVGTEPASAEAGPVEAIVYEWAGRTARCVGVVVHRALCQMARDGLAAWSRGAFRRREHWGRLLAGLGVAAGELEDAVTRVERALENVLADPRGRWLLDERHAQAHSEYSLTGVMEAGRVVTVVIDRTFVAEDGVRWIVDYKTGSHAGAHVAAFLDREQSRYRAQLERYGQLMERRETRPIRLGLYFPLLCGWREWGAGC